MVFIALNSILELLESAYSCTSSAFLFHHWFCMLRSSRCALALQSLYLSRLEEQFGWFCQSMNAFLFSSSSACTASSFSSNQSWWTFFFGPSTDVAVSVTTSLNWLHLSSGVPVSGPLPSIFSSKLVWNSWRYLLERRRAVLKATLTSFGRLRWCGTMQRLSFALTSL